MAPIQVAIAAVELIAAENRIRNALAPILLRRELVRLGEASDGELLTRVREGGLRRLAHGAYIDASLWESMFPEQRLLAVTLAHAKRYRERNWVFARESAAALWGLPLYGFTGLRVHVATREGSRGHSTRPVARYLTELPEPDIVDAAGVRFTSLERTLLDLAHSATPEVAIGALDAGIRRMFQMERGESASAVAEWRERRLAESKRSGRPGVRAARQLLQIADGRAESVLESVSKLQLSRLQVPYDVQVPVRAAGGTTYWMDFELLGQDAFGEVDGTAKYFDRSTHGAGTPEERLLAEKRREDEVRGVTGKRFVRWGAQHIHTARRLGERLSSFGIAVSGLEHC
ncbi:hypothetical protein [Leucobacter komagatae]|uniref:hypothetical protein n=1 Tax=Leucobacter komagatae TaxID=55969 RepID=UPI0011500ACE|nr:hypothetical protein [Leucobacter komagatae]